MKIVIKKRSIILVLLAAMVMAACNNSADKGAKYMQRGNDYFAAENYDKARVEYKNAIQIDPKNAEAYFALGKTLEKINDYRGAIGYYRKVIELDSQHTDAMFRIGRIYLLANALDDAMEMADKALAIKSNDASAIALRGAVQSRKGRVDDAMKDALMARRVAPDNADVIALLASLYVNSKENDKAISTLEDGIKLNSNDTTLRTMLANIYSRADKNAKAIALMQEVISLEPTKFNHRAILATYYDKQGDIKNAEQVLRTAVKEIPDLLHAKLTLVSYLAQTQGFAPAEAQLQEYIKAEPENAQLSFNLASLYLQNKQTDKAITICQEIIDRDGVGKDGLFARIQLAKIYITENDMAIANKLIAEVLKENPQDKDALVMRGTIALQNDDQNTAIADFRTVLRDRPDDPEVLRLLARAHLANKEPELALAQYEKAISAAPTNTKIRLELAQLYFNEGDKERALKEINAAVKNNPNEIEALSALYKFQIASKDYPGALDAAEKMKQIEKAKAKGYYAAGLVYQQQGKLKEGYQEFDEGLKLQPDSINLITALTKNLLLQKRPDAAIARLNTELNTAKEIAPIHNLLGEIYLARKDTTQARHSFEKAIKATPQWFIPYRNLAAIEMQLGNTQGAIDIYKQAERATNANPMITYGLAGLYEKTGKTDEAIKQFEDIINKSPDSPIALNNLAMLLTNYRGDSESLARAAKLMEPLQNTDNPYYLDTLGWLHYKQGDIKQAIPYLSKAVEKAPDVAVIHYHMGMALYKRGDKAAAKAHLEKAVDDKFNYHGIDEAKQTLQSLTTG